MINLFKKKHGKKRTKSVIDLEVERCKKEACDMVERLNKLVEKKQSQVA